VIIISRANLEVAYANPAARRIVHPLSLVSGGPVPDPWPGFSLPKYVDTLVRRGVTLDHHVDVGHERTYVVSGVAGANAAVVLLDDVSQQERRRRAEREFVANAAHELLTPLTGIVGAAHVLEAGAKEVPEDRDRFIAHIAHECERLARIARSLLVLARAQSGEEPPRLEVIPVCSILADVVATLAGDGAPPFSVDCPEDVTILADADLFTVALSNLVTNALRHGSGDDLAVKASEVGGNRVEIEVRGGNPLSSDEISRIQRRFQTGSGPDRGGFGLGLSIAMQSIEAIGGRLTLEDATGDSAIARIELASGRVGSP